MIGDEIIVDEATMVRIIGNQNVTVDVLVRRIAAKDNRIKELEAEVAELKEADKLFNVEQDALVERLGKEVKDLRVQLTKSGDQKKENEIK